MALEEVLVLNAANERQETALRQKESEGEEEWESLLPLAVEEGDLDEIEG